MGRFKGQREDARFFLSLSFLSLSLSDLFDPDGYIKRERETFYEFRVSLANACH